MASFAECARSKDVRCRTILCGGIYIVDGRHVFTGDLNMFETAVTYRRLDDRRERPHSALSTVTLVQDFQPRS